MTETIDFDCNTCGACCAYEADWPSLETEHDKGLDGPLPEWVSEDGHVRWSGDRCSALDGAVGSCTSCRIYARRPSPCRGCLPGSVSCLVARRHHHLPVPVADNELDALVPM